MKICTQGCGPVELPPIKNSRFVGWVFPVQSNEEVRQALAHVRHVSAGANHVVHAFRFGTGRVHEGCSDDGEPRGTSGMPCLKVLAGRDVSNVVVCVARFFGGVKLGTGGLARAYAGAANAAADEAVWELYVPTEVRTVEAPLSDYHVLARFLSDTDGIKAGEMVYGHQSVSVQIEGVEAVLDGLRLTLQEATRGRVEMKTLNEEETK